MAFVMFYLQEMRRNCLIAQAAIAIFSYIGCDCSLRHLIDTATVLMTLIVWINTIDHEIDE